jgi:NADH-quinone oxidoreductase subunit L
MFIGVGAGAAGAAVFHLVTHAFFKALLFLGAGSVIHATGTQSMREMGGLRRFMPTTFLTMCVGALALAALVPLSGFFSKDMILFEVLARSKVEGTSGIWQAIYVLGVLTGGVTAIYSARMICMTFMGEYRGKGHPHESPFPMTVPLAVLAVCALGAGLLGLPEVVMSSEPSLPHFLSPVVAHLHEAADAETLHSLEWLGLLTGVIVGLAGAGLGVWLWNRPPAQIPWEAPVPGGALETTRDVLSRAWLYDELVNKQGVQPATKYLSHVLWKYVDDQAIDRGLVDGAGRVAGELSSFTRAFQTGQVARYASYFAMGAIALPLLTLFGLPVYHWLLSLLHGSG